MFFFILFASLCNVYFLSCQLNQRSKKVVSEISEDNLYDVICRLLRFIMNEIIHPQGEYFDKTGVLENHLDIVEWTHPNDARRNIGC